MASCVLAASRAEASSYVGAILTMRSLVSPATPGNSRVAVQISGATSCPNSGWYVFDLPDAGVGKA